MEANGRLKESRQFPASHLSDLVPTRSVGQRVLQGGSSAPRGHRDLLPETCWKSLKDNIVSPVASALFSYLGGRRPLLQPARPRPTLSPNIQFPRQCPFRRVDRVQPLERRDRRNPGAYSLPVRRAREPLRQPGKLFESPAKYWVYEADLRTRLTPVCSRSRRTGSSREDSVMWALVIPYKPHRSLLGNMARQRQQPRKTRPVSNSGRMQQHTYHLGGPGPPLLGMQTI